VHAVGNPRLEATDYVVGQKSYRAAEETRQARDFRSAQPLDLLAQRLEGIIDVACLDRASRPNQIHVIAARAHYQRWFGAEKGVASPLLTAAHAFEQERVVAACDLRKADTGVSRSAAISRHTGTRLKPLAASASKSLRLA